MESLTWSCDLFKKSCLIEYLVACASAVQFSSPRAVWIGNLHKGNYHFGNGSGDEYRAVWQGDRLLVFVFDHESERSPYDAADVDWEDDEFCLRKWVGDFPEELRDLYQEARPGFDATTAGLWGLEGKLFVGHDLQSSVDAGLWMLERHSLEAEDAVFGGEVPLIEEHSISEEQGNAVLGLLEKAWELPYQLSPEDIRRIMIVGESTDEFPIEGVDVAKAMLRAAGYLWD